MLDAAVLLLRLAQYASAMILFGAPLVFRSGPAPAGASRLIGGAAGALALSALLGLLAQTCVMAGSISEGLKPEALAAVITTMALGPSSLVRVAGGLAALAVMAFRPPSPGRWSAVALVGAAACVSFAWMGHGASTEGPAGLVHLAADALHALAAGLWIGALAAFLLMARRDHLNTEAALDGLHAALSRFSGSGATAVATLVATGLINSWFLVGPSRLPALLTTTWGHVLGVKLGLFAAMLALAAANRFRLTPELKTALRDPAALPGALARLRMSLTLETAAGLMVLGLVAWLGTLAPIADL